jgi:hypothetical protein
MRTSDLSEAWKNGRASSKDLARTFAGHARGAAQDFRGRAHDLSDSARGALHDLKDRAVSIKDRRSTPSRSFLPATLSEARSFGRQNAKLLTAGGALLGLAAGGVVAKAREKKLAANGTAEIAPPADKLGRDVAHQGESAGLAEFVEPQSATFPLAGGRRAKARTSVSTEH